MIKRANEPMTIIIGGDMDRDTEMLFAGKPEGIPKNIFYMDTFEDLYEWLSPKRIELLRYLIKNQDGSVPKSISVIAKDTKRFQEAISKDIKHLVKLGLVKVTKEKQSVYAYPNFKEIIIKTK